MDLELYVVEAVFKFFSSYHPNDSITGIYIPKPLDISAW